MFGRSIGAICSEYKASDRVAYVSLNGPGAVEQRGLMDGSRGTVLLDGWTDRRSVIHVRWDKGFEHSVSVLNLRKLDVLELLVDERPGQGDQ